MESNMGNDHNKEGLIEYVRKSTPPPFLLKTYMLVEDPATDDVISWNADGTGFVVWQTAEFARDLLPTLFKHSNFSSFVRQLNTYGFRKVATSRWEFCNDLFRKDQRELLRNIRRRKTWANNKKQTATNTTATAIPVVSPMQESDEDQRSSSTFSSSGYNSLVDENKRLRKENGVLSLEVRSMKRKYNDLLGLVAKYSQFENDDDEEEEEEEEEEDEIPKLFGVRLEVAGEREKKKRAKIISESSSILLTQSCK